MGVWPLSTLGDRVRECERIKFWIIALLAHATTHLNSSFRAGISSSSATISQSSVRIRGVDLFLFLGAEKKER